MTSHNGKVALVTGGSSGIGACAARELLGAGFTVYAVARRTDRMQDLADAGVHTFAMDVTDDTSMTAGIGRIIDEQGRIDVLVNNAGYGSYGALEDVPMDEARRQFDVNVFGLARLIQLVTPHMREQAAGRIINISSIGAHFYEPFGSWYHATKFAVNGLSDSLRIELKPFGIDVITIEPAGIITEWNTIARDSLLERSGDGPYATYAKRAYNVMKRIDRPATSSTPDVVGRKIAKAATTSHPLSRYRVGKGASVITNGRRMTPDLVFDQIVGRIFGTR
ncbi:oxidoreductase [Nocardioides terrisoli]|uniref:oxidoreductase n=1 Tax=Nocardioides terrisoli TaxID=3388267 RepID=UPI00287BBA58|nr:oxidoreductase [Nocardioides marmorisolisilvae]